MMTWSDKHEVAAHIRGWLVAWQEIRLTVLFSFFAADFLTLTVPRLAQRTKLDAVELEIHHIDEELSRPWRPADSSFYLSGILPPRSHDHEPIMIQIFCEPEFWVPTAGRLCCLNRELQRRAGMPVHTVAVFINGGPAGLEESRWPDFPLGKNPRRFHYTSLGLSGFPATELLRRPESLAWALAPVADTRNVGSRTELRLACLLRALELWRRDPAFANRRWDQLSDFIATSVVWEVDPLVLSEEFLADPSEDLEGWISGWMDKVTGESIPESWQSDWLAMELLEAN